eukprot:gene10376-15978_t
MAAISPNNGVGPDEMERLMVKFYVQVITAEVLLDKELLSRVDEVLDMRSVKRFCNQVAFVGRDEFALACVLRACRCLVRAAGKEDPAVRKLLGTILTGMLVGPTTGQCAYDALRVVIESEGRLDSALDMLAAGLEQCCASKEALFADLKAKPQTGHLVSRVLFCYEQLFLAVILHEQGVETLLQAELVSGAAFADLLQAAWTDDADQGQSVGMRYWAVRSVAALCIASPRRCLQMIPFLWTAAFVEEKTPVGSLAVALLWDLAFVHPQLGASVGEEDDDDGPAGAEEAGERSERGSSCGFQFLPDLIDSPVADRHRATVYGMCRLLLTSRCSSPEYLLAKLTRAVNASADLVAQKLFDAFLSQFIDAGNSEVVANGVVQLCVELHSSGELDLRDANRPPLSVVLLAAPLKPFEELLTAVVATVQRNFCDFFGVSPDTNLVHRWLGLAV